MSTNLQDIHAFAISLAIEAGDTALNRLYTDTNNQRKGDGFDVVTAVDYACEERMIARIRERYPDHGITGEEHGVVCNADASVQWLLDPLDGTNNYVMGFPLFGNCISVLEDGEPIVATVHDNVQRITTSAYRGGGAWRNGEETLVGTFDDLRRTTISWTQGYAITTNDQWVRERTFKLQQTFKRLLQTWSPSIDWSLLASGKTGAFIAWKNELHDLVGGELIVSEAGGEVWKDTSGDLVIAGAPEVVAAIRQVMGV